MTTRSATILESADILKRGGLAVTNPDDSDPEAALLREMTALIDAIRAEEVPPAITALALRLQEKLDAMRETAPEKVEFRLD